MISYFHILLSFPKRVVGKTAKNCMNEFTNKAAHTAPLFVQFCNEPVWDRRCCGRMNSRLLSFIINVYVFRVVLFFESSSSLIGKLWCVIVAGPSP
jgi:hypothetical protein